MAAIKDLSRISSKWARVSAGATQEYLEGVQNPRKDWEEETRKAEPRYEEGVQAAIARKAFGKGVRNAGTAKWQQRAVTLGPQRFATGVAAAVDAYATGFEPFRQIIASLNLPPRGPKGSPQNILRVAAIAKALHDKKLALAGA